MVLVDVSGPEAVVMRCRDGRCEEVGRFAAPPGGGAGDGEGAGDVAHGRRVLLANGAARARTALRLSPARALGKRLALPLAAEAELRNVLYHQIESLTPFRAEEACFGYRVVGRDRRAGELTVELTVVPRTFVDAALRRARSWGIRPGVVDVGTGSPAAAPEINLISGTGAPRSDPWARITGMLSVLALGLALAAALIPLKQAGDRADRLIGEAAALRRASEKVLALRRERDALERRVRFVAARKGGTRPVLAALAEIARILPKDTWLEAFSLDRPEIRISGYSASAASLIGRIDASPLFRKPRFRSPVTRSADEALERFNISFEFAPTTQGKGE
jgi:general secretion pathway protein L